MNVTQLIRFSLIFVACALIAGCADEPLKLSTSDHAPVAGESTPPPQTGPRGGWAW
jgi:hypothetical protein